MELFECSECLKLSRESRNDRPSLGESAFPFIGEGDGLTSVRECETKRVCVLPSLVAHTVRYKVVCRCRQTVLYPAAWATRLGNTLSLSLLTCKAVPFIYKRGCALSQQRTEDSDSQSAKL